MKPLTSSTNHLSQATAFTLCVLGFGTQPARAHLTYPAARNLGTFNGTPGQTGTVANQSSKANGWADGTDADWAPQDNQRYLQFTLLTPATVNLSMASLVPGTFYPAFTLFSGLGHAATDALHPDFDGALTTQAYLSALPAPTRLGAFTALGNLTIGNDDDPANNYLGSLVTLAYMGNAADGTSANYGSAAGINGDGLLDGNLTATFALPAGAYTLAVSGADYHNANTTPSYGFNTTLTVVPEPTTLVMLCLGGAGLLGLTLPRRRGVS